MQKIIGIFFSFSLCALFSACGNKTEIIEFNGTDFYIDIEKNHCAIITQKSENPVLFFEFTEANGSSLRKLKEYIVDHQSEIYEGQILLSQRDQIYEKSPGASGLFTHASVIFRIPLKENEHGVGFAPSFVYGSVLWTTDEGLVRFMKEFDIHLNIPISGQLSNRVIRSSGKYSSGP
ncbi:MAG: hypothetical protein AAF546_09380 [Verrucomicrobiota bacterium]